MDVTRPVAPRPVGGRRSSLVTWWAARTPLVRDVTVVLIAKAIVLGLLWFAFFRTPAAPHMKMEPQRVAQRLLAPTPAPEVPHAIP